MIGLDTTALIDLFKENEEFMLVLNSISDTIFLNQMSYLELMIGIDSTKDNHKNEESFYDALFSSFSNLNLDNKACKKARDVYYSLKKRGKKVESADCVIAGIYLANGVKKILTKNKKHFENIKDLVVVSY